MAIAVYIMASRCRRHSYHSICAAIIVLVIVITHY